MLNVVCVKWGDLYNADYINILADSVLRNLSEKFPLKFICFTDNPQGIDQDIDIRPLPDGLNGWWNKLYLFKQGLFPEGDRILYLDLDTVITGALDDIVAYDGKFAILRDFYRPDGLQSSVMAWESGYWPELWGDYQRAGFPDIPGGDQAWIEQCFSEWDFKPAIWQDRYPDFFHSYKVSCRKLFPKNTKMVIFHGEPRPHQVTIGWVPQVWKMGGGTTLELQIIANTDDDTLIKNIKHAVSLNIAPLYMRPEHDRHAVIVGGGPSLADCLDELRFRQSHYQAIFATNNTYRWLDARGIRPSAHVMLDARPENAEFVPAYAVGYYASQCHPSVFKRASNAILWHSYADGMDDVLCDEKHDFTYVGGGCTVGLKAMCIAYILGYRKIHLYGFDSCYKNDSHHAYAQPLNDRERVIDISFNGRIYKVAPWMATQVEEFKTLAEYLVALGCTITTHGDGLLQDVAASMVMDVPEADIIERGGIWWPARDIECRYYMDATIGDIDQIVAHCDDKSIVVQAGGNVGIWPNEFARHFEQVITFEPDALNYQCLVKNIKGNVTPYRAGLGDKPGSASLEVTPLNVGAHFIKQGSDFPLVTIDGLGLTACGLIQLDIEGYELNALKGARNTIEKFSPVICVEDKGLSERFGSKKGDIGAWLAQFGYIEHAAMHRDIIYKKRFA